MRAIALSVVLCLATGCSLIGQSCTLLYAPDGVMVTLLADGWAPGLYEVEVNGEFCFVTLPGAEDLDCSVPLQLMLDDDATGIEAVMLTEETPGTVDIVLLRDGEPVDAVTVEPAYEESEPNGKGCGTRAWAEEEVEVDAA